MFYIADLHVHSRFSRATSKNLNLESLYQWARIKGINVVGTGDFTHPQWFREIQEKLEPDGNGFFRMKNPPKESGLPGTKIHDIDVRFCLSSEISSIYKFGDKVRKNHNLVYAPDLETVSRINARLSQIGNLTADGRPILGLPSRDLLEIITECSEQSYLIPAHVWTPWFSTLGSKGGYDSVDECFRDLSHLIFAIETGLSSDPEMNWRWSALDRFALVSNSDAHSPQKLGREATLFDTELSYVAMFNALKSREGFMGTYEFFPQEGKYHLDGHRKCGISVDPAETKKYNGICPVCGRPLTVGVLNRVESLSDRPAPHRPGNAPDYSYIIPLPEILAEIKGTGPTSKNVQKAFQQALSTYGNEFSLLTKIPVEDIHRQGDAILAEAIQRMRRGDVTPRSGYDGVYGVIKIFEDGEIENLSGQMHLFGMPEVVPEKRGKVNRKNILNLPEEFTSVAEPAVAFQSHGLNEAQQEVKNSTSGAVLVKAGPGTGKTGTLIRWIQKQIETGNAAPSEVLAITFTNKAAREIEERLRGVSDGFEGNVMAGTFHAIAWRLLQQHYHGLDVIYDEANRLSVLRFLFPGLVNKECRKLSDEMAAFFERLQESDFPDFESYITDYRSYLAANNAIDISDLTGRLVQLWENNHDALQQHRNSIKAIAVDEFQDINLLQYKFIRLLADGRNILAIGDPDQAIYGFRGADVKLFFRFEEDFHPRVISLTQNYRSVPSVIKAASALISHNSLRSDIELQPERTGPQKISLFNGTSPDQEAAFVLKEIEKKVGGVNLLSGGEAYDGNYAFSDIAVLYRTHHVGKQLLSAFNKANIPVVTADGNKWLSLHPFSFITNTFRLYLNPDERMALEDILGMLPGWSAADVRNFLVTLHENNSDWRIPGDFEMKEDTRKSLSEYVDFFNRLPQVIEEKGLRGVVKMILARHIPLNGDDQYQTLRMETILTMASEAGTDVHKFLENAVLNPYTDAALHAPNGVRLLTFHAAKGLEFPVVFIAGAEDGITPAAHKDSNIEEERRLFYVAMTRARDELYLTYTSRRTIYGKEEQQEPSSFISEIPRYLMNKIILPATEKKVADEGNQLSLF